MIYWSHGKPWLLLYDFSWCGYNKHMDGGREVTKRKVMDMDKRTLIDLIEQTTDIKNNFTTACRTVASYPDRPPIQRSYQTIRTNREYALWRARIEAELVKLPQSKTVEDIYKLFTWIEKGSSESYCFTQLEARLIVLKEQLQSGAISRTEDVMKAKDNKIFISHSSKDVDIVKAFVELLEDIGMPEASIVCTSVPGYGIPGGRKIYEWLREQWIDYNIHMIFMLSHNYYDSVASLNEMGAAWLSKTESTLILLPGFKFSDIRGCIDPTEIGIALEGEIGELKHRLGELKDCLCEEFQLPFIGATKWERYRDSFIEKIQACKSKLSRQELELGNDYGYKPTTEQYNDDNISVEAAFLLVYAAAGDGKILKIATLGSPMQVSTGGRVFMSDCSQRESAIWQEALDTIIHYGWVKSVNQKGQIFELTGTGYKRADWLRDRMDIDTSVEPLNELKKFDR